MTPSDRPSPTSVNPESLPAAGVSTEKDAALAEARPRLSRIANVFTCWSRAIRIHHWTKNLLMLSPLVLAHRLHLHELLQTLLGAVLFGLCSSAVYILNDLLDVHSDRSHPWKSARPFASGDLSIASGIVAFFSLIGLSVGLSAALLNFRFAGALCVYLVTTTCYSLIFKKVPLLDVFVLSSFYSLRIWSGALITSTPLSLWFLGFSLFFFLSLAIAKRYSELVHASDLIGSGNSGRNYRTTDQALLMNIGTASCFSAIVILSLYVHSDQVVVLYRRPGLLFLICPLLLYWTTRIWLKASRGELDEDPVTLAMSDGVSYCVAALGIGILLLSS